MARSELAKGLTDSWYPGVATPGIACLAQLKHIPDTPPLLSPPGRHRQWLASWTAVSPIRRSALGNAWQRLTRSTQTPCAGLFPFPPADLAPAVLAWQNLANADALNSNRRRGVSGSCCRAPSRKTLHGLNRQGSAVYCVHSLLPETVRECRKGRAWSWHSGFHSLPGIFWGVHLLLAKVRPNPDVICQTDH